MNLKTLSSEDKIAYLIKPILKVLQEAGGQLERSEIKERIADLDDQIAEYSVLEKKFLGLILLVAENAEDAAGTPCR